MKHSIYRILLLVLLVAGGCGQPPAAVHQEPTHKTDTFMLCDKLITIDTMDAVNWNGPAEGVDTAEVPNLLRDSALMQRRGDSLVFALADGRQVCLVNCHADNDSVALYTYLGFNKDIGQYVVYARFYEGYSHLLLDRNTGDTTFTCGPPVVSPDKQYFVCGNTDLEAHYTFNGFALYKNTHRPTLVCERELDDWGPAVITWPTADVWMVKGSKFTGDDEPNERPVYYKLTIK